MTPRLRTLLTAYRKRKRVYTSKPKWFDEFEDELFELGLLTQTEHTLGEARVWYIEGRGFTDASFILDNLLGEEGKGERG